MKQICVLVKAVGAVFTSKEKVILENKKAVDFGVNVASHRASALSTLSLRKVA
jgi:hypothetical protein